MEELSWYDYILNRATAQIKLQCIHSKNKGICLSSVCSFAVTQLCDRSRTGGAAALTLVTDPAQPRADILQGMFQGCSPFIQHCSCFIWHFCSVSPERERWAEDNHNQARVCGPQPKPVSDCSQWCVTCIHHARVWWCNMSVSLPVSCKINEVKDSSSSFELHSSWGKFASSSQWDNQLRN